MLTVTAPAKINLTLEVLWDRADGFHEIRSVMQVVSLCDMLSFRKADKTTIRCDMADWSAEKSLISRVIDLLREATGCKGGAAIDITKKIPLMSGLGGDSSDTAAVIKGLNELWGLRLTLEKQSEIAAGLGSDVPFFLRGGTALAMGRGDAITALPSLPAMLVVLVLPDVLAQEEKTARMYRNLKTSHHTDGRITERLVEIIRGTGQFDTVMLFNTFENVAFKDNQLQKYKEHLIKLGAPHVHLAGSGPALFTMFEDGEQAQDLYTRCEDQKLCVYLTRTNIA